MQLSQGITGHSYVIGRIRTDDITAGRLRALGVREHTPVTITNKKSSGAVVIKVRGSRLALGCRISKDIEVKGEQLDADRETGASGRCRGESELR